MFEKISALFSASRTWLTGKGRTRAFLDTSAWLLIAPVIVVIYLIDPAMAKTLWQWSIIALAFAGLSIIISRVVFPHIRLTTLVESAQEDKNVASAIVAAAIILFVAVVMLSVVLWAKT
jgi:hypothetical protein